MLAFHFQKLDHSHFLFCRRRKSRKGQEKQTPQAKTNKHNQENPPDPSPDCYRFCQSPKNLLSRDRKKPEAE